MHIRFVLEEKRIKGRLLSSGIWVSTESWSTSHISTATDEEKCKD